MSIELRRFGRASLLVVACGWFAGCGGAEYKPNPAPTKNDPPATSVGDATTDASAVAASSDEGNPKNAARQPGRGNPKR